MIAPSRTPLVDPFEAVKYDIRLHGFRFISVEFVLMALGAAAMAAIELLHASRGALPVAGGVWFLGVAVNCLAVLLLAWQTRRLGSGTTRDTRRVHIYALQLIGMLLIPLAVALAAAYRWRAGAFEGPLPVRRKELP